MRTTVAGTRIVVKATITNGCLDEGLPFDYKKGDLGVLDWDWDKLDWCMTNPRITVIWDHDPEKMPRKVLLDNITPVGLNKSNQRVLVTW